MPKIPIKLTEGITLSPGQVRGIHRANVIAHDKAESLSWDRYVRLRAAAKAIRENAPPGSAVLDAGGYDGALAFFLPDHTVDVIDPATTGGDILRIPVSDRAYPVVAAIDVLEHVPPDNRAAALHELIRVADGHIVLNYPSRDSKEAQILALQLTNNPLIREHVEWELPDSNWVVAEMTKHGFVAHVIPHTSVAIWISQYTALNAAPTMAEQLNRHLVKYYAEEPSSIPLYHLVVCSRC
jgi:hypothetical protein